MSSVLKHLGLKVDPPAPVPEVEESVDEVVPVHTVPVVEAAPVPVVEDDSVIPEFVLIGPDQIRVPGVMAHIWKEGDSEVPLTFPDKPAGNRALWSCRWIIWDAENGIAKRVKPQDWWIYCPKEAEGDGMGNEIVGTGMGNEAPDKYIKWELLDLINTESLAGKISVEDILFVSTYDVRNSGHARTARTLVNRLRNISPEYVWREAAPPRSQVFGRMRYRPGW